MKNRIKQLKNHKEQIDNQINLFQVENDEDILENLQGVSQHLECAIEALEYIVNKKNN